MPNIRPIDMMFLEELLEMGSGYVLNFSDKTFTEFFAGELNIDIDDPMYAVKGGSKGKRMRCFLQTADKATVVRVLNALWEYRELIRMKFRNEEKIENAHGRLLAVIDKLQGEALPPQPRSGVVPAAHNRDVLVALKADLLKLSMMQPQARGYAFEKFLKDAFDKSGLQGRASFRLQGEQIDGSFLLGSETYLLEAKWQNERSPADHLHSFNGKVEQKAGYTRGLFLSYTGFTEEGLVAFGGRGRRIICMDGLDLHDLLEQEIPLNNVLEQKVRRFAETGFPFIPVRDLFPK